MRRHACSVGGLCHNGRGRYDYAQTPALRCRAFVMSGGDPMPDTLTDHHPETRAEIEEALTSMAATAARMPAHWAERRAKIHGQLNDLLDALEQAPE